MDLSVVSFLKDFGTIPMMFVLIIVVYLFLKDIRKGVDRASKNIEKTKNELLDKIAELKKHSDEKDADLKERLLDVERRLYVSQKENVTKEQFYKHLEGWRSDLDAIAKLIRGEKWKQKIRF